MLLNPVLPLLLGSSVVSAFPHIAELVERQRLEKRIAPVAPFPQYPGSPAHATYNSFNATSQLVNVHGANRWIAPGPGDIRGPCAGLNAAANHGYLPRNGIATSESISDGLWAAFSLDHTATIFLETATRFFDGNPLTGEWSIGYASNATQLPTGNALGQITGICDYGHGKTEADASITRGDFLAPTNNSNCASYPIYVEQLFELAREMNPSTGWLDPQVMAHHQYLRKLHSIETNPNYFSPAYGGVAFTFGAHMFAVELLSNHSAEYPRGYMTPDLFLSMWGYTTGKDGALIYKYGHERIPENFYKRAPEDAWTLADILISTGQQCLSYPTNCQVGGNTGTVNSFEGVDLGNITGGFIQTVEDLGSPEKMGCFISQAIQADVPSFLDALYSPTIADAIKALIPTQLMPALAYLGTCPNLPAGKSVFAYGQPYPGSRIQGGGPRASSE